MEGAWRYCRWWDWPGGDSGEGPLSGTGMRNLSSHHKNMKAHPGSRRWRRDAGGEPLSSGFKDFGEGKKRLNSTFLPALVGTCPSSSRHGQRGRSGLVVGFVCPLNLLL